MFSPRLLALLFATLLAAYSVEWIRLVRQPPPAVVGFDGHYQPTLGSVAVTSVQPRSPAEYAGLRGGDRIVAIDNHPIDRLAIYLAFKRDVRPDVLVHLKAARGADTLDLVLKPRARPDLPPGASTSWARFRVGEVVLQLLAFYPLPFLIVAVSVLLQRPEDPHAWLLAAMLGGFVTMAPMLDFEYRMPVALRGPLLAIWTLLSVPLPAITYAFFSIFPAHSPLDRRIPWLKWVAGVAFGLFAMASAVAVLAGGGSLVIWWLGDVTANWWVSLDWMLGIYTMLFFMLATVSLALNAFGTPDVRRKTRVILFGMVVGLVPVTALQIAIGVFNVRPQELPFGIWAASILALFAIPVTLGYAVVKHRAMEIPVLLRRSARYLLVRRGLVTLAILVGVGVTLVFARVVNDFSDFGGNQLSAGLVAGSVFGGLLALVGQRAWQPAAERLDQAFFRGAADARRLLQTLADQSRLATDRSALAALIDQSVTQALHPRALLVFLRGASDWQFDAAAHHALVDDASTLPASKPQLTELGRRGRPLLIDPVQLAPGGVWASFAQLAPEAIVPMVGRSSQIEGVLVLGQRLSDEPYSGEDVSLLASVGTQAGLALENIRLAESMAARIDAERRAKHELEIARDVQAKLLPQSWAPLATLDYAGACLQARVVGGDFFDFASPGSGQVALVLADISGKGISAALLMASLQANLRALYAQAPGDLAGVLTAVNRSFFDSTAPNHYATLFFGLYDGTTRELRYANCGHLPPILLRAQGCIERLEVTAPVIGLFHPWECETRSVNLAAGDTLVVFTDGVSEATSDTDEEFGEERLIEVIRAQRSKDAVPLLQGIVNEVRGHSGREQFDDLTLIVAKVK